MCEKNEFSDKFDMHLDPKYWGMKCESNLIETNHFITDYSAPIDI